MAVYRVTGPDGATYQVTAPDNATPDQIKARVQAAAQAKAPAPRGSMASGRKPKSDLTKLFAQGATFGLSDEIIGGAGALADAVVAPFSKSVDFDPANSYRQWRDAARADVSQTRKEKPWLSAGMEVIGGLGQLPAKAVQGLRGAKTIGSAVRQGAKQGAKMGAVAGFGYGEGADSSLAGAGLGAVTGAGLGAALPIIGANINRAYQGARNYFSPQGGVGRELVSKALAASKLTPKMAAKAIQDADARGVPIGLADLSTNLRGLAGGVSRQPGAAREFATSAVTTRQAGQGERVQSALVRDLGPVANRFQVSDDLSAQAQAQAGPLYREAFEGGSLAPLESQFQKAFADSGSEVSAARKALSDAQRRLTQAGAKLPGASNVYASSAANRGSRDAEGAIKAAQNNLARVESAHAANLARLRQAQADGSANAPGAVWSPRIQQFLDDPITKSGIGRGVEIQRLEALAEGRPFNPAEYAIMGMDDAGNPIVGAVPNMRLLDAAKRGLDDILDQYPKDVAGRSILDQRGRAVAQVKKSLLAELDGLNPAYSSARAAFAGPAASKAALAQGYKAMNASDQELERMVSRLGESERDQFALGFRSALSEAMERRVDGADKVGALLGNPRKRKALAKLFGGEDGFNNFLQTMADERAANETFRKVTGGSDTARFLADDAAVSDQSMLADAMGSAMRGAADDGWRGVVRNLAGNAKDAVTFGAGKAGERAREDAAALLFETNPQALAESMRKAMRDQALRRVLNRNALDFTARAGGRAGQLSGAISGYGTRPVED